MKIHKFQIDPVCEWLREEVQGTTHLLRKDCCQVRRWIMKGKSQILKSTWNRTSKVLWIYLISTLLRSKSPFPYHLFYYLIYLGEPHLLLFAHPQAPRTKLISVSYCKAEPELAVTTLARRNIPCSSSSFLIPRTWESRVCKSRSWRYFSLDPQMKSRSLRTWRRTNGVCWIIKYLKEEITQSLTLYLY